MATHDLDRTEMMGAQEKDLAEMLLAVVRSLVDRPDQVEVVPFVQEQSTTFRVWVDPTDVGKVIGMNGRTARALRTIVAANSSKQLGHPGADTGENTAGLSALRFFVQGISASKL